MIAVETYCGICGAHCCSNTDVEYRNRSVKLTITCPECLNNINIMEQQIAQLNEDLEEYKNNCNKL
jgi:hypothetical protein